MSEPDSVGGISASGKTSGAGESPLTTGPHRELVRSSPRVPVPRRTSPATTDLYARDGYAQVLLSSLIRAQLGLTVSVLAPAIAMIVLYPLLCVLVPAVATAHLGAVPVSLIVLAGGIYPPLVLAGFWYVRRARQVEQRFVDLLNDQ